VLTGFWWGNLCERDHLEDLDIDGKIILKWKVKNSDGRSWTGFIWLRIETYVRLCKRDNEPLGYINCGKFLDWLWNY
jgi:hypothetical protein